MHLPARLRSGPSGTRRVRASEVTEAAAEARSEPERDSEAELLVSPSLQPREGRAWRGGAQAERKDTLGL